MAEREPVPQATKSKEQGKERVKAGFSLGAVVAAGGLVAGLAGVTWAENTSKPNTTPTTCNSVFQKNCLPGSTVESKVSTTQTTEHRSTSTTSPETTVTVTTVRPSTSTTSPETTVTVTSLPPNTTVSGPNQPPVTAAQPPETVNRPQAPHQGAMPAPEQGPVEYSMGPNIGVSVANVAMYAAQVTA